MAAAMRAGDNVQPMRQSLHHVHFHMTVDQKIAAQVVLLRPFMRVFAMLQGRR
jgi:hypothetical protein